MTIDEIKRKVSKATGVPVHLLSGETEEECRARALAVTAFVREYRSDHGDEFDKQEQPKSNAQLFKEFFDRQTSYNMFNDPDGFRRIFGE